MNKIFKRSLIILGIILALILVVILITSIITAVTLHNAEVTHGTSSNRALNISVTDLAENPEKYDGNFVRVKGVFIYDLEDVAIYPSQDCFVNRADLDEDAVEIIYADGYSNFSPGIWLDDSSLKSTFGVDLEDLAEYRGKYMVVEGYFNSQKNGHFGAFPGSIEDMSYLLIEKGRKIYTFERKGLLYLLGYWFQYHFPSPRALWWLLI